jgi:hypothetical protein
MLILAILVRMDGSGNPAQLDHFGIVVEIHTETGNRC